MVAYEFIIKSSITNAAAEIIIFGVINTYISAAVNVCTVRKHQGNLITFTNTNMRPIN